MLYEQGVVDRVGMAGAVKARRYAGWPLALLASTALVAVPPAMAPFGFGSAAFADGGSGGYGDRSFGTQPGGAGGATSVTGPGGNGADSPSGSAGAGGGGAGTVGGAGGAAAAATTPTGTAKGGAGGSHGGVLSSDPTQTYAGTDGGDGNPADLGSGGGGAGGYGLVLSGGAGPYTVGYNVTAGKGGKGGNNRFYDTGSGGDGGVGLYVNGTGLSVTINNAATITGGAGGAHGTAKDPAVRNGGRDGADGVGGYGIYGEKLTLTLNPGTVISGGLSGDGVTRANSIYFGAGSASENAIVLDSGMPTLTGTVGVAAGAAYTLHLTGTNGGTFDLATIDHNSVVPGAYSNLSALDIDSGGTWVFTGNDGANPGYGSSATLKSGILQLGNATKAGVMNGAIFLDPGTTLTNGAKGGSVGDIAFNNATGSQATGTLLINQRTSGTALAVGGVLNLGTGNGGHGNLIFNLRAPSATALITAGTLDTAAATNTAITLTDAGGLDEGSYLLISAQTIGANVTASTLTLGSTPAGLTFGLGIGANAVTLTVSDGQSWNGTTTSGAGPLVGGTGTWRNQASNDKVWSDGTGATHVVRDELQTASFAGTAGIVTVDSTTNGAVKAKGLTFGTTGYEITGGDLTLDNPRARHRKSRSSARRRRQPFLRCWPAPRASTSAVTAR